jgi:hypothetical protein
VKYRVLYILSYRGALRPHECAASHAGAKPSQATPLLLAQNPLARFEDNWTAVQGGVISITDYDQVKVRDKQGQPHEVRHTCGCPSAAAAAGLARCRLRCAQRALNAA